MEAILSHIKKILKLILLIQIVIIFYQKIKIKNMTTHIKTIHITITLRAMTKKYTIKELTI